VGREAMHGECAHWSSPSEVDPEGNGLHRQRAWSHNHDLEFF
jgi:hypothetical protein